MGDRDKVAVNMGSLVWTPETGSGGTIGYTGDGIHLLFGEQWEPVTPEDLCSSPLDYIRHGGPIIVMVTAWQWDGVTRNAMAPYFVSGNNWVYDTVFNGRLASEIAVGTLAFTPTTPPSGKVRSGFTIGKAVALLSLQRQVQISYRRRVITEYLLTWGALPDDDGQPITLTEVAG